VDTQTHVVEKDETDPESDRIEEKAHGHAYMYRRVVKRRTSIVTNILVVGAAVNNGGQEDGCHAHFLSCTCTCRDFNRTIYGSSASIRHHLASYFVQWMLLDTRKISTPVQATLEHIVRALRPRYWQQEPFASVLLQSPALTPAPPPPPPMPGLTPLLAPPAPTPPFAASAPLLQKDDDDESNKDTTTATLKARLTKLVLQCHEVFPLARHNCREARQRREAASSRFHGK
jgi:hypothetical protein